jgi:hypothetical protein
MLNETVEQVDCDHCDNSYIMEVSYAVVNAVNGLMFDELPDESMMAFGEAAAKKSDKAKENHAAMFLELGPKHLRSFFKAQGATGPRQVAQMLKAVNGDPAPEDFDERLALVKGLHYKCGQKLEAFVEKLMNPVEAGATEQGKSGPTSNGEKGQATVVSQTH